MLNPADILEGFGSTVESNVFVVGAYDSRITFYSQQVRGLQLAYALKAQGRLKPNLRIAVVGAGAAGVAAAAALALLDSVRVVLFETGNEILPLQKASQRRHLDPHIFDWPEVLADDPVAGLPILDWKAGPSRTVREEVKAAFEAVCVAVQGRLEVKTRCRVLAADRAGRDINVAFDQHAETGPPNAGSRAFDLVILAFGFGLEDDPAGPYVAMPSYWDDGGVPGPEFTGRPQPRFLVSGDGDGALIDLVAAASANFDHAEMLSMIAEQPGIDKIVPELVAIDQEGRAALRGGKEYDYGNAYDARILPDLRALGLFDLFSSGLRTGVHITLQTRTAQPFNARTATLNRLAAYLVTKACDGRFEHIEGALTLVKPPAVPPYEATHWFKGTGSAVGVHTVIVRHGPNRARVRKPFDPLLAGFDVAHARWLETHFDDVVTPKLSKAARQAFEEAARAFNLPMASWRVKSNGVQLPWAIGVNRSGASVVWSGDVALADCAKLWEADAPGALLFVRPLPNELPNTAAAVLRLVTHAGRAEMKCDVGPWTSFAVSQTSNSPNARRMPMPRMSVGTPAGTAVEDMRGTDAQVARTLHETLNRWMLDQMSVALRRYIQTALDPGLEVTIRPPPDLRQAMKPIWDDWEAAFRSDPELLDRFLRLMMCAHDDDASAIHARVIVGPKKLGDLLRATAVAIMVAAGWANVAPAKGAKGNLSLTRQPNSWTGHACGAELIDRSLMAMKAGDFMWRTNFVVLPLIDSLVTVAQDAETTFAATTEDTLRLTEPGRPNFILTTDPSFRAAAETSLQSLTNYLTKAEGDHFGRLRDSVESAT